MINTVFRARDFYIYFQNIIWVFPAVILVLFVVDLVLNKARNRSFYKSSKHFLFYTGVGTLSLSALIILVLGGFTYFTSFVQSLFLPGIGTSSLINLASLEVVKIVFWILSTAVWISIGMLGTNYLLTAAHTSGAFNNSKKKNKKLAEAAFQNLDKPDFQNTTFQDQYQDLRQGEEIGRAPSNTIPNQNIRPVHTQDGYTNQIQHPVQEAPISHTNPQNININNTGPVYQNPLDPQAQQQMEAQEFDSQNRQDYTQNPENSVITSNDTGSNKVNF